MSPDALIVSLYGKGISLSLDGTDVRWHGPKGAMSPALLAALKGHKPLIVTVLRSIDGDRAARDWEAVREWIVSPAACVPHGVSAAGARLGLPYSDALWPEAYTRYLRVALRVRGILRALRGVHIAEATPVRKGA